MDKVDEFMEIIDKQNKRVKRDVTIGIVIALIGLLFLFGLLIYSSM